MKNHFFMNERDEVEKGLLRKIDGSQPYPIVADDVRIVLGHFV